MSNQSHPWLPTTKKQGVLVYALNVLLLLNLTVIVVMLTAATEPTHERASAPPSEANERLDRPAALLPQPGAPEQPVAASPAAELIPLTQMSVEPFVLASPSAEQDEASPSPQPQPQADPPVTFFGIGLD